MSRDSIDRFGFEMTVIPRVNQSQEWQFLRWMGPLSPDDFRGKRVLDAGCGTGRNSYFALKYGARELVAFDYDERTVTAARATLAPFPNARVEFKNVYDSGYRDEFDLVMCIGVFMYLDHPERAIANLVQALKPGGTLLVWVYGDDFKFTVALVKALRIVTTRLPPRLLWYLSYVFSVPLYVALRLFKVKSDYFQHLADSDLHHVHAIVFDQLLPVIARYYDKASAARLIDHPDLTDKTVHHTNNSSWTLVGIKVGS